jgi:hypothetical protein
VPVYFGYSQAHEDAAQRAVRAGRALIETVGELHIHRTSAPEHVAVPLIFLSQFWNDCRLHILDEPFAVNTQQYIARVGMSGDFVGCLIDI